MVEEQTKLRWNSLDFKGHNDRVTYVDKQTEEMLVRELGNLLPEAEFVTEEDTVEQTQNPS